MSEEQLELEPGDIFDRVIRNDVVRLQEAFPSQTLETCYFWYLYHNGEYDATVSSLNNGIPESFSDPTMDGTAQKSQAVNINLGVFPAEIWQIISSHLSFRDLSTLRLTNSVLADISAESMLQTVRFDLSFASLERLRFIAGHQHLRKNVKTLTFEAGLLGEIGCIHQYAAHYEMDHHKGSKPQPPPESQSTPQAERLYARNLAKFSKELDAKYAKYRIFFEAQERLLNAPKDVLFRCIDKFPNIRAITFITDQCRHLQSQRFIERYGQDCAVPMSTDSSQTSWELQHVLRPGVKCLHARLISPNFFNGESGRSRKWLQSIFKNLDHLSLGIRHNGMDRHDIASMLRNTNLSYAIGTATNLTHLTVNFSTILPVGQLKDIMPQGRSFQKLKELNIESFTATENEIMDMLKLQPVLRSLDFADVMLSTGLWHDLLRRLRDELQLESFTSGGVLSDVAVELCTDHYSSDAWQDGELISLGVAIDLYITDSSMMKEDDEDEDDFEFSWNPVNRVEDGDFMPYDNLVDEYGPINDSDLENDFDNGDEDDDDESDSDDDSDGRSMHTADEGMNEKGGEAEDTTGHPNNNSNWPSINEDEDGELPDLEDMPPSPMSVD